MKSPFYIKTLAALVVVVAAVAGSTGQAQDQPMPPPANNAPLPPEITPDTPLAQVVKLVQAGVDETVINNYVATSQSAFNLDADKIMTLTDLGVPKDLINAMLERDKVIYAAGNAPTPAPAPAPETTVDASTAPPTQDVTVDYFDNNLTPYGSWVSVDGYGRCWRPTTVIYDSGWRPYCDRGHWVYTDCGWYWDSDYAWGVTFHYGRWFRNARFGWCWYPDTEWAPSWVTWRSSDAYCGWAPLPPLAVYRAGEGFFYRGASVDVNFGFGLGADYFTFVSPDHFCEPHPRRFAVDTVHVREVFNRTTVVNNFSHESVANSNHGHDNVFVNRGIAVQRVSTLGHRPIEAVQVGSLPNATRQGWRGVDAGHPENHAGTDRLNNNNYPNRNFGGGVAGQAQVVSHQTGSTYVAPRPTVLGNAGNQNGQHDRPDSNNKFSSQPGGNGGVIPENHANYPGAQLRPQVQQHVQPQTQSQFQQHVQPQVQQPVQQQVQQRVAPSVAAERVPPEVQQHQYAAPSQAAVNERIQQHEERVVPQVENTPSHVEAVPHNNASTPAPNPDHDANRSSDKDQKPIEFIPCQGAALKTGRRFSFFNPHDAGNISAWAFRSANLNR